MNIHRPWTDQEALWVLSLYLEIKPSLLKSNISTDIDLAIYKEVMYIQNRFDDPNIKRIFEVLDRPISQIVTALHQFFYLDQKPDESGQKPLESAIINAWESGNPHFMETGSPVTQGESFGADEPEYDSWPSDLGPEKTEAVKDEEDPSELSWPDKRELYSEPLPPEQMQFKIKDQIDYAIFLIQQISDVIFENHKEKFIYSRINEIKRIIIEIKNDIKMLEIYEDEFDDFGDNTFHEQEIYFKDQIDNITRNLGHLLFIKHHTRPEEAPQGTGQMALPDVSALKAARERLNNINLQLGDIILLRDQMESLEEQSSENQVFKEYALTIQKKLGEFLDPVKELLEKYGFKDLFDQLRQLKTAIDTHIGNTSPVNEEQGFESTGTSGVKHNGLHDPSYIKVILNGEAYQIPTWKDAMSIIADQLYHSDPDGFEAVIKKYPDYVSDLRTMLIDPLKVKNSGYYLEGSLDEEGIKSLCANLVNNSDSVAECLVITFDGASVKTINLKTNPSINPGKDNDQKNP